MFVAFSLLITVNMYPSACSQKINNTEVKLHKVKQFLYGHFTALPIAS